MSAYFNSNDKWKLWIPPQLDHFKKKNLNKKKLKKKKFYQNEKDLFNKILDTKKEIIFKKLKLLKKKLKKKISKQKFYQDNMKSFLSEFKISLNALDTIIARKISYISLKIASKVILRKPKIKQSVLLQNIQKILKKDFQGAKKIDLYIHEQDKKLVKKFFKKILKKNNFFIIVDNNIFPGGCRVSFNKNNFDANIPIYWKKICKEFFLEDNL
jgi:flagellar biosynthesis/type III secretory pathway protein FliH